MQRLEVSGLVRLIYRSLGVKGLKGTKMSSSVLGPHHPLIHRIFGLLQGIKRLGLVLTPHQRSSPRLKMDGVLLPFPLCALKV